jgi:hypothetical protein
VTGALRRVLSRLTTSDSDAHAAELQENSRGLGATPVRNCVTGDRQTVSGRVRALTLRPVGGVPALEAELFDGTGVIVLVFLGRRQIRGIDPGRSLSATGRVSDRGKERVMFNPAYQLHS